MVRHTRHSLDTFPPHSVAISKQRAEKLIEQRTIDSPAGRGRNLRIIGENLQIWLAEKGRPPTNTGKAKDQRRREFAGESDWEVYVQATGSAVDRVMGARR